MSVCAVMLPDLQMLAVRHDGEGAAAWGACRPFENLVDVVAAIIDISMHVPANRNRRDLFLDGVDPYSVSRNFCATRSICTRLSGCPRVSCDLHHKNTNA